MNEKDAIVDVHTDIYSHAPPPTDYLPEKKKKKKNPNPPSKWTVSWTCPAKGDGLFKVLSFWIIEH